MTKTVGPPRASSTRSRVRVFTLLFIVLTAWGAFAVALGASSRVDRTCSACHAMRPYVAAMADSGHASVGCGGCHSGTGLTSLAADGVAMQRRIMATVLGRAPSASTTVSDAPCRTCHAAELEKTIVAQGVAVRHSDFSDTPCVECHAGTGHALEARVYSTTHMDDCLTCHRTNSADLSGCTLCHVDDSGVRSQNSTTAWRTIHGANWQNTHGAGDLDTCGSCHPRSYCVRCHGTPVPHGGTWNRDHGATVLRNSDDGCATCHEASWCDECHTVPMPHDDSFTAAHPATTQGVDDPRCMRCHVAESCQDCHLKSAHPDVPGVGFSHGRGDDR